MHDWFSKNVPNSFPKFCTICIPTGDLICWLFSRVDITIFLNLSHLIGMLWLCMCVYILLNPMDVVLIFILLMINDFEHLYMCPFDICVYSSLGYILSIIRLGCLSSHRTLLRILLFVLALRQLICSSGWS